MTVFFRTPDYPNPASVYRHMEVWWRYIDASRPDVLAILWVMGRESPGTREYLR